MSNYNSDVAELHTVLVNDEGQYSLWNAATVVPSGWHAVRASEPKEDCLRYIEENWTDMRPLSLRERMQASAHQ